MIYTAILATQKLPMISMLTIKLWAVPALELCTTCLKPFSACYTSSLNSNLKQHDSTTGYLQL